MGPEMPGKPAPARGETFRLMLLRVSPLCGYIVWPQLIPTANAMGYRSFAPPRLKNTYGSSLRH
jgi:hypothetical protein